MTNREQMHFHQLLANRLVELDAEDLASSDSRSAVTLDQQSVGRLSRMDAMQQQAMAKATHERRKVERHQIGLAQARLEDGSFGECTECGEDIAPRRLELAPTVTLCINCASR